MRLLITGGSGFIGRNLVEGLRGSFDVVAPTRAELDLLDAEAVHAFLRSHVFDVVVYAATWDATRTSSKDRRLVLENNLRMFHNVARVPSAFGRLVHLGSGAEYGRERDLVQVTEAGFDEAVPGDHYGYAKYLLRKHCEATPGFVNLSLFGVFGRYEDWRLRFLSNACCHAVLGLPIEVGRDALFDYIAVDDVVAAVAWCVANETEQRSFNVCRGEAWSLVELAGLVRTESGKDLPVVVRAPGRSNAYVGDPGAFVTASGWKAAALRDGISTLYRWYDGHRDQIDRETLLGRAWATAGSKDAEREH
ncbi:MAG: NAD(P)-dependent oxidoreductase [Thermoleophilia bacterium]